MRSYFLLLISCLTNPTAYLVHATRPLKTLARFFVFSLLLVSVGKTFLFFTHTFPEMILVARSSTDALRQLPDASTYQIVDGVLTTTNAPLPLLLPFPQDTTLVLASQSATLRIGKDVDPVVFSFTDLQSKKVTKQEITSMIDTQTANFLQRKKLIGLIVLSATLLRESVGGLLTIGLFSLLLQTFAWVRGIRISYFFAYRIGILIFPIASLVNTVSNLLFPSAHFPLTNAVYVVISLLIIWDTSVQKLPTVDKKKD